MGESLAKDTLLIFVTTLIKHIRFENPTKHPKAMCKKLKKNLNYL